MKKTNTRSSSVTQDLPDSKKDRKQLEPEETTIDLPEVKDIPGQEHIQVPPLGELADTTISSAGEEGHGLLDDLNKDETDNNSDTDVSTDERIALRDASEKLPTRDQDNLDRAKLDRSDEDGELLNEKTGLSGSDLDVPGSEDDDANEEIGEEDEENNAYSLDSEDEDDSVSKGENS
jgi:hypothetical protein